MNFVHYGLREEIIDQYLKWCEEENFVDEPHSLIFFMMLQGWLNEKKICSDLQGGTKYEA